MPSFFLRSPRSCKQPLQHKTTTRSLATWSLPPFTITLQLARQLRPQSPRWRPLRLKRRIRPQSLPRRTSRISLPLVAILMDLSFTPSLVKTNGQEDRNAFITTVGADPAVGGIQLFTTTKGSASVTTEIRPQISPQKIATQGPVHTPIQRDRPVTMPCKRPHAPLKSWMTQNPQPSWSTSKKRPLPSDLLRSLSRRNCRI